MTLEEAATKLDIQLRSFEPRYGFVGITDTSIVVYLHRRPTAHEKSVDNYEGFPISWKRVGKPVPLGKFG